MSRRQRILLYAVVAGFAFAATPENAEARQASVCPSIIQYYGSTEETGAYGLVLPCGESMPEGGCYDGPGGYKVFDCDTEVVIGTCDGFTCAHTE
jgi:hypothetical protein